MSKATGFICDDLRTTFEHGTGSLEHIGDACEQQNQHHPQHHCGPQQLRSYQGLQQRTMGTV